MSGEIARSQQMIDTWCSTWCSRRRTFAFSSNVSRRPRQRSHSTSSIESQLPIQTTQAHFFKTLSEETIKPTVKTFSKVPVRDDSPPIQPQLQESLSSTQSMSPTLFLPYHGRRQRLRSQSTDSEDDEDYERTTNKDDTENSSSELQSGLVAIDHFRPRAYATPKRMQKKRKVYTMSSTESHSEPSMVTRGHTPPTKEPSVERKDEQISILKVIIVGEPHTGKTSLLRSYIDKDFCFTYEETKGRDFYSCTVGYMGKDYRIHFWDTAGQERFVHDRRKSLSRSFFKNSSAAFIVYDSCRPETLDRVPEWKEIIDFMVRQRNGDPIPVFILANKCEVEGYSIDFNVENYCRKFGFAGHFKCSAKNFDGMDVVVNAMVKEVLKQGPEVPETCIVPAENVVIDYQHHSASPSLKGCCS